jgi:pimeloyl-ACP methyl ester carboxylesterase
MIVRVADGKQAPIEMAGIRSPTFLIWGGADPFLPEPGANAIARYLKNANSRG